MTNSNLNRNELEAIIRSLSERNVALRKQNDSLTEWIGALQITVCTLRAENEALRAESEALHDAFERQVFGES